MGGSKFLSTLKKAATVAGDVLTSKGDILTRTSSALARLAVGSDGKVLTAKSSESTGLSWEDPAETPQQESFIIACSDESTALTTGTAKVTFRMPYAFTLNAGAAGLTASCNQAPTGAILTIDVNDGGTTIMDSTKLTIAIGSTTSVGGTAPVLTDVALAANAVITIDIDQIGSTNAGTGLKVTLIGVKA
jgi:hypothetical protein